MNNNQNNDAPVNANGAPNQPALNNAASEAVVVNPRNAAPANGRPNRHNRSERYVIRAVIGPQIQNNLRANAMRIQAVNRPNRGGGNGGNNANGIANPRPTGDDQFDFFEGAEHFMFDNDLAFIIDELDIERMRQRQRDEREQVSNLVNEF